MTVNTAPSEIEIVEAAVAWLQGRLPADWTVERKTEVAVGDQARKGGLDAVVTMKAANGTFTTFAVEAKSVS